MLGGKGSRSAAVRALASCAHLDGFATGALSRAVLRCAVPAVQEEKEKALKASAGNRAAWNTLFMRADTVAEAIASHYGVS